MFDWPPSDLVLPAGQHGGVVAPPFKHRRHRQAVSAHPIALFRREPGILRWTYEETRPSVFFASCRLTSQQNEPSLAYIVLESKKLSK